MNNEQNKMPYAVFTYCHHNRRVGSMITLRCKTDFALRTDVLQTLGNQLAMHISAFGKFDPDASWLMDNSKKVKDVINEVAVQLGEPVILEHVHVQGC